MKVLWLCDERGWAYDNASRQIAVGLPQYEHAFAYYKTDDAGDITKELFAADAIVCSHPAVAGWPPLEPFRHKMLLRFSTRTFRLWPNVYWFCDMPGWAYEQRAKALAQKLPGYVHRFIYYWAYKTDEERKAAVREADIVICLCVAYATLVRTIKKALVCVGGYRLLGIESNTID